MFGRHKPILFESHGSRRARARVPGWVWLLLLGTLAGAAAVLTVQQRYLPPRLSATDSAELRMAYEKADAERTRLRAELDQTAQRLQAAQASQKAQADELATARGTATRLREDLASLVASLPPDPRDSRVAVRAGRFTVNGSQLDYNVVLSRERAGTKPLASTLKLVVAGDATGGKAATVATAPIRLQVGSHEVVRGSMALPEGFKPRQTTVQLVDAAAGTPLGMRVLLVQ